MHDTLYKMTITAKREEILKALRANRETHIMIVAEARKGYIEAACDALEERLVQAQDGKLVSLRFSLVVPQDHTKVYDTAIKMMEMHTEETVSLTAQQVRHLIQDDWEWKDDFIGTAAQYSKLAENLSRG